MSFCNRIRKIRIQKGYSQEYMAAQLDISQNAYCKIENEQVKIKVDTLLTIAKVLEVALVDLFNEEVKLEREADPYEMQCMLYKEIIKSKDDEIKTLKALLQMRSLLENKFDH